MTISEKKKASNYKWDRENMTTLGCRLRRDYAERIKAAAAAAGTRKQIKAIQIKNNLRCVFIDNLPIKLYKINLCNDYSFLYS